jgi:hypothetical protein
MEKARDAVMRIREARSLVTGQEPSEEELAARTFDLLSPLFELPELLLAPGAKELGKEVARVFPESSDPDFIVAGMTSGLVV